MPRTKTQNLLKLLWHTTLVDYVTAIAWSPDGTWFAASSAAGEVVRYDAKTGEATVLQEVQGESVDALAISADGAFLAAGGQSGTVWIWQVDGDTPIRVTTLEHPRAWIDRLQWNPRYPELAFSLGRYAQVWDAATQAVITTLNFESSSVLDLAWHPQGDRLIRADASTLFCGRSGLTFECWVTPQALRSTVTTLDGTQEPQEQGKTPRRVVGVGSVGRTPGKATYTLYNPADNKVNFKAISYSQVKGFGVVL